MHRPHRTRAPLDARPDAATRPAGDRRRARDARRVVCNARLTTTTYELDPVQQSLQRADMMVSMCRQFAA